MNSNAILASLRGGLIVSCQAYAGEVLFGADVMSRMALAAKEGGAVGIRANSPEDIAEIKSRTALPIIGIWKESYDDSTIYITPTMREIAAVCEAGSDIVAIDATERPRPGGVQLPELIAETRSRYPGVLLMADVSTFEEGLEAQRLGFDIVSTTLSGYTPYSPAHEGPDLALVGELAKALRIPVFAEGRIATPDQAAACLLSGAYAIVVGGAITRPEQITKRFVDRIVRSAISG